MTRALPRTNFNRSRLVRTLSGWSGVEFAESNQPLAERLGQWLGVADAIALHAVLGTKTTGDRAGAAVAGSGGLREELERLRAVLEAQARQQLPVPSADLADDFGAYRRYYLSQQRGMATGIDALRGKARAALARRGPRARQLAALDEVLAQALAGRERELFAAVPLLFERGCERRREEQEPGRRFGDELLALLLAELELRLQPVTGLVEAYDKEVDRD